MTPINVATPPFGMAGRFAAVSPDRIGHGTRSPAETEPMNAARLMPGP